MNRKEADAFFGKLEEGLKENFTIPKRKLSSSPDKSAKANKREASDSEQSTVAAEANSQDVTSPEKNEDEDANALAFPKNTSPSKTSTASGYDRKPPGYKERPAVPYKRPRMDKRHGDNRRPPFGGRDDPLGLSGPPMSYGQAEARGLAGDLAGIQAWAATFDGPLPQDLLDKCRPAQCDLCTISLSSTIVAKTHYFGKNHEKHTRIFLEKLRAGGVSVPNKVKAATPVIPSALPQNETRCDLCNIEFTSAVVALSHYKGKKHLSAERNSHNVNPKPKEAHDPRGQFGIGMAFYKGEPGPSDKKETQGDKTPEPMEDGELTDDGWSAARDASFDSSSEARRFFCLPCKVYFGSQDQYSTHIKSGEHKSSAFSQMGEKAFYCSVCMVQCNSQDTYDTHLKNPSHKASVSAAAAPSLQSMMSAIRADPTSVHFCQVCQVQCSGQQSYDQHVVGKKHLNKAGGGGGGGGGGDGHKPPPQQPPVTSNFHCQICGIYTTDQNGLNMHFEGKNHKKKAARQQQ